MNFKFIKRTVYMLLLLFFFSHFIYGQTNKCGTKSYTDYILSQNPSALSKMNEIEETTLEYGYYLQQNAAPLIIPVVVHVVYNTSTQNISDSQIQSQIEVLNNDYRKLNSDISNVPQLFENDASDCNIEFRLALYDPNGNTTNGITRTQTNVTKFNMFDDYVKISAEGGKDIWDSERYLNIWVCNLGRNPLGYSPYPGIISSELDGVVIDYTCFGKNGTAQSPNDLGRTATHEIGHWLNLIHIWGDDDAKDSNGNYINDPCTYGDDLVYDTPNQEIMNWYCPTFPSPTCNNESDMFMNYMDYVDDACMYMFTNGQKQRMQSALFVVRDKLRPSIYATPNILSNLSASGGTATFQLTNPNQYNSINWTIEKNASWITSVNPASGVDNATVTITFSVNNSGEERAAQLVINANDELNSTITVFIFQNTNQPKTELVLMNVDDDNFFQFDNVGLLKSGVWDIHVTSEPYKISENQLITAKFSVKYFNPHGKFHRVTLASNPIVSYENYSLNLPYGLEYRGRFKPTTDCLIENIYPELGTTIKNLNSGSPMLGFKDPWYSDLNTQYGVKNRGLTAVFHYSAFDYDLSRYINSIPSDYKGVFLNQDPSTQDYYYEVRIPKFQDITTNNRQHYFYLYEHEYTNSSLTRPSNYVDEYIESPIVFTNSNPSIKNYYKGTQLSNNVNAYSSSSQLKFIKVPYTDYLVSTYESMDRIWLEGSTDNGITWSILNDGQPINGNTVAKNPSLGVVGDCRFAVVYQENSSGNKIKIKVIEICGPSTIVEFDGVVDAIDGNYDANPVVAIQDVASNSSNLYLIVWDENYVNSFSDPGLHYRILERNSSGNFNFLSSPGKISNTDASSLNPSLAADFRVTSSPESHLAWQQDVNISTKKIKYYKLKMNYSNNTLDQLDYYEPSSGSGFSKNYNPSITVVNNGTPRLSWIGYRITDVLEKIGKNSNLEAQGTSETRAILRYRAVSGVWYGTFYKLGSEVYNVNIAYVDNYSRKYIMGWSSGSGSSFTNSYIKGYTSPIYSFGTTGKYLQVSNSYDVNTLWGNSFQNSTAPYSFTTSYNGSPQKTNTLPNNVGREGVVRKGDVQFFFTFGDITADNEIIDFAEFKDSLRINNLNKLNRNLITKPFEINSKSTLTFSVSYGIADSLFTENEFESDESVNFHVELVDSKTNNVIGVYSDVTYNKSHLEPSKSIAYEIDSEGIGEKTVELRLVVEDKMKDTKYSLAELHSNERILGKTNYKKVTFNGELKINNYSLSQNYPNPFNPQTTISYQLPNDGIVTLKVYDILGKEITVLVNEYKTSGRYNIIFDGSNLASGIYFYTITVGAFKDTKKLILIK